MSKHILAIGKIFNRPPENLPTPETKGIHYFNSENYYFKIQPKKPTKKSS
jgi:hypothetical protein